MVFENPSGGESTAKRSWFSKPENRTALFLGIPAVGGLLYGFSLMLPWLISLTTNTIYLVGLLLVLGAILYVLADRKNWILAWYMYRSMCRWLTGWFVNIDPIGIMKSYAGALREHFNELSESVKSLRGSIEGLETKIQEQEASGKKALEIAHQAKKRADAGDQEAAIQLKLSVRQYERCKESNKKYILMHQKLVKLYEYLKRLRGNTKFMLSDFEAEIVLKEDEHKAITQGYNAMNSAMKVIGGDEDKLEIFNMACESLANDMAMKAGSIQDQLEQSKEFMLKMDLMDDAAMENGMRVLEERGKALLDYQPGKTDIVLDTEEKEDKLFVPIVAERENDEFFSNFLSKEPKEDSEKPKTKRA